MEIDENKEPQNFINRKGNKATFGILIVIIGIGLLLQNLHFIFLPNWLISWPTLIIIVGILHGTKVQFRSFSWIFIVLIGAYFLIEQNHWFQFNLRQFTFPVFLILMGLFFIFRRREGCWGGNNCNRRYKIRKRMINNKSFMCKGRFTTENNEGTVFVESIFSHVEHRVISKDLEGGSINSTFGGAVVDFTQADFNQSLTIAINCAFGGVELIVPSNWVIVNELSVILGGIDDKRRTSMANNESKTLTLTGSVVCGGVELKSY